jgi:CRP-like cAMP-binding protein
VSREDPGQLESQTTLEGDDDRLLKPLSGLGRTLSAELAERQMELKMLLNLNAMVESRTYEPGEIIIRKGDTNRDLFFVTEGRIEISTEEEYGALVLNVIESPHILGDIAFLSGFARTATAKAKTHVRIFILKYDDFRNIVKESPEWLNPFLTSFVAALKSLHEKVSGLEKRLSELNKD